MELHAYYAIYKERRAHMRGVQVVTGDTPSFSLFFFLRKEREREEKPVFRRELSR